MKNFRAALSVMLLGSISFATADYAADQLQWLDTSNSGAQSVVNNGKGTWTIGMNLNVSGLNAILQRKDTSYGDNGNALFTATGKGATGVDGNRTGVKDQSMTTTIGWGNEWYYDYHDGVVAGYKPIGNAVNAGFQLGVTTTGGKAANLNTENGSVVGGLMGIYDGKHSAFDVYRADMKLQEDGIMENGSYDWSISETGKATATTLDQIATMTTIDQATLFVVHTYANDPKDQLGQLTNDTDRDYASDSGDYTTAITYTTFYLTVIGKDKDKNEVVYNYMGQFDDDATYNKEAGSWLGGSDWYDVDMLTQISNINTNLVDSMVFVDHALTSADRAQLMTNGLPEPGTATLSLMALAGLAARRRRR